MSSTANMTRCRPSVFAGAFSGSGTIAFGVWYFASPTGSEGPAQPSMAVAARAASAASVRVGP